MARRVSRIWPLIFPNSIWSIPNHQNKIYLTFDDGPTEVVTDFVLKELARVNAQATFFAQGSQIEANPEVLSRVIDAGHLVGNHTYLHENGCQVKYKDYHESIEITQQLIDDHQSRKTACFRPPYGRIWPWRAKSLANDYRLVFWTLMAYDFDEGQSPAQCLKSLIEKTREGDIVVFHDNQKCLKVLEYVLPRYLDYCLTQDFKFSLLCS